MKPKKARLVVETTQEAMSRFAKVLKNPQTTLYKGYVILSFPSFATLGKVITGARLELLAAIREYKPQSIQQLAKIAKRDFKNVYQDVKLLAQYGLIELKENGARKAAVPVAIYTELMIAA